MAPPIGPVYQVTYQMALNGATCENVVHYRGVLGVQTDVQIRAAAEVFLADIAPAMHQNVTFPAMIIKQMTPIALDEEIRAPVSVTHGGLGGEIMNNTIAVIVTKRTGVAGKSHRGRFYFPGVPFAFGTPNFLATGGQAAWQTAATALLVHFGPDGTDPTFRLGVYSRVIGGTHPFTDAGWQQVTGLDVQPVLGNQRRRRVGVGI